MYESEEENGLSHFFEHIVFKNINHYLNGDLYKTLDRLGLSFNACTYRELIQFTISGATKHFEKAAEIFSYLFLPIHLPDTEIKLELKRILAEIREADEKKTLDYFSQKKIWKGTTLCQSIPGKKKILKRTTCEDLRAMQKKLLTSENCFYYMTGAVTEKDADTLCKFTERFAVFSDPHIHENLAPIPANFGKRKKSLYIKESSISEISFAFDFHTDKHTAAERSVLYDLLFTGEYCRTFVELSENTGYIYSYDSHLDEFQNICNIYLSFEVSTSEMLKAASKVTDILCELKRGEGICLDYVLPVYLDNSDMQLDDAEGLNYELAYERHFLNEKWKNLEERNACYRKVTPERIQKLACEIFRPENLTLCYKGKKKDIPPKLKKSIYKALSEDEEKSTNP